MGDPRAMGGQPIPITPRFRVIPGSDENRMSPYNNVNRPQRPMIRPSDGNPYMYQTDNNNFQQPPPRMSYQVRPGLPIQRMPQMNINQRMSPSMMMPPPQHRPQMQSDSDAPEHVRKEKLMRLFKSFCSYCNKNNKTLLPNMLSMIERFIRGQMNAAEFLEHNTQLTGIPPRDNLQGFLENNIGLLRTDLESGKLSLDHFLPNRISAPETGSSPQSMHTSTASPQSHPGPSPGPRPTSSGPSPMQKIMNDQPNSEPHPRMSINYSPLNHPPASAPTFDPTHRGSISDSSSNSPHMFAQSSSSISTSVHSVANIPSTSSQPSSVYHQTFTPPIPEKKIKIEEPAFATPSLEMKSEVKQPEFKIQSTFTPAAPVAGPSADVAFKEISTEPENSDKCIFDRDAFVARLHQKMPECAAFEEQILTMLSSYLETKVRSVLDKAYEAAEHRLEQLRVNPTFSQKDDPKVQLRILEKQDKLEQQKRADSEKESIIKLSKGKGKDADMTEKAKKIKKADEEAALNREANEAAIAALGSKKRKFQTPKESSATPSSSQASNSRTRVKQVTSRDLLFVFERDQFAQNSILYRKMLYGLIPSGDNNNKQQP